MDFDPLFQGSLLVIIIMINGSRKNAIVNAAFELRSHEREVMIQLRVTGNCELTHVYVDTALNLRNQL